MNKALDWDAIDTVLLDMDGTLIDHHYEAFFWDKLLPKAYARKHRISFGEARQRLKRIYSRQKNTFNWADIDFWQRELGMHLWKMRFQLGHLIRLHPHTLRFLKFLKKRNKRVYLVTGSMPKDRKFKLRHAGIGKYFDAIYSQSDAGVSKYEAAFWERLQKKTGFEKSRALLIDDSLEVLKTAKSFGIMTVLKGKYNSRKPAVSARGFVCVRHLDGLL